MRLPLAAPVHAPHALPAGDRRRGGAAGGRAATRERARPWLDLAGWLARRRVALGFACGVAALWLSRPTWTTWTAGCAIALAGEMVRIWAAGHVEKNREVTASGPYRFSAHPLYVGSAIIGVGFAVSAASPVVAVLVGAYLAATIGPPSAGKNSSCEGGSATGTMRTGPGAARTGAAASALPGRCGTR